MCRCRYFHLTYFQHLTDFSKTTNIAQKEYRTKQFVLSHNCFSENIYIYLRANANENQKVLLLNILAEQIIIMQRPTYRQPHS